MLDDGIIAFNPAVELAFLTTKQQKLMVEAIDFSQASPSLAQAQRIKNL